LAQGQISLVVKKKEMNLSRLLYLVWFGTSFWPVVRSLRLMEAVEDRPNDFTMLENLLRTPGDAVRPRVIFSAGLEGSGHHFIRSVMESIPHSVVRMPPQWGCSVMGTIWSEDGIPVMQDIFRELHPPTLWVLRDDSYPCYGTGNMEGRRQHLPFHPRVDWMYQAAAAANIDLHVLYLYRPLDDALAADCIHRHFMSCSEQAAYLNSEGALMLEQLRNIPPNIISCFRYGNLDVMEKTVSRHVESKQAEKLVDTLWSDHVGHDRRESISGWNATVEAFSQLQRELDMMCTAATG